MHALSKKSCAPVRIPKHMSGHLLGAANLLKPALARGDLHCIGATTGAVCADARSHDCSRSGVVRSMGKQARAVSSLWRGFPLHPVAASAAAVEEYRKHIEADGAFARRFQVCPQDKPCTSVPCRSH